MESRLQLIKEKLKQARNDAYLGKYNQSIVTFKSLLDTIQQEIIMNNISNKHLDVWKKFQTKIIQEKRSVDQMKFTLNGFNNSHNDIHQNCNMSTMIYSKQHQNHFLLNKSKNFQKDFGKTKNNFRTTTRNLSMATNKQGRQAAYNNNFNQQKDPDIWDPPQPLLRNNKSSHKVKYTPQNSNNKIASRRPEKKQIGKGKFLQNGKKSFLIDRYPEGTGPDAGLIEMLEREVLDTCPNIQFDDIAELQKAKGLLQEAVLLPLKMPQFFTGIRRAWKGVLMFGPPGTGKTLLAKAVASSGGTTFFNVSASSLASKWKGQSQKLVRILFQMAKFYAPAVIFFDQIDALGGKRKQGEDESNRKVKTQLLVQMDGATSGSNQQNKFVIVLAATNRPWDLDQALRRRLQKRIYIPLPNQKGRKQLINIHLKNMKVQEGLDLDFIVKKTDGYSGADITNVCRQAAYMPMRKKLKKEGGFKKINDMKKFQEQVNAPLTKQDFLQALKNVNKSVGKDDLKKYETWMNEFGTV